MELVRAAGWPWRSLAEGCSLDLGASTASIGRERVSMGQTGRRLMTAKVPTTTGLEKWDRSQIWTMLRNLAYQGFGKRRMGLLRPRLREARGSHAAVPAVPTSS
jgi:Recombinase